jgi:rhodanese-related sulfurtransferase
MIKQSIVTAALLLMALVARADVVDIDSAQLARLVASGVAVVDIRTAPEWKETGVIAGSKLFTFIDEKGRIDVTNWLGKVRLAAKPGEPVILICRSGNRSKAATQLLSEKAGYKVVYNAGGGMNAWIKEGKPVVSPSSALVGCVAGAPC